MGKIVRLTESDLVRLVKKVIKEQKLGAEFSKEKFLNDVKNIFLKKGYKVVKESPLHMKKGLQSVRHETIGGEFLDLSNSNYNDDSSIYIYLNNYNPMGPFKVEHFTRGVDGNTKKIYTENLNGNQVFKLIEKYRG